MNIYFAGSATKEDRPEAILANKVNAGALLTYFDIYYNKSITKKRIKYILKRNMKGHHNAGK